MYTWRSLPIFVNISNVSIFFSNKTISSNTIPDFNENIDVKKWTEVIVNHRVNVVGMSVSRIAINCAIEEEKVVNYLRNPPVRFPDKIWSKSNSVFYN